MTLRGAAAVIALALLGAVLAARAQAPGTAQPIYFDGTVLPW